MKGRDEIIAEMLLWSQDFIEQLHRVFGGLPICPFAKAAWLRQSIRFEVLCFAAADLFEPDGRVMTLIGEFLGDGKLDVDATAASRACLSHGHYPRPTSNTALPCRPVD